MDNTFAVWMPLMKSRPEDETDSVYRIHGVASTEEKDQQGETLLQQGIDFQPFIKGGYFNWNHLPGPENIIGRPTSAEVMRLSQVPGYNLRENQTGHEMCLYVSGELFKGLPRADATWQLMQLLATEGAYERNLGYSVEGTIVHRVGKVLAKSIVRHCAVTHEPVNAGSWAAFAKARGITHAYSSVDALVKSVAVENGPAGPAPTYAGAPFTQLVLGLVPCSRGCHNGEQFAKGRQGMLAHFVECAGWDPDIAVEHITRLYRALK